MFFFQSCSDSTPDCIDDRIDEFTSQNQERSFTYVYQFEQDGDTYFIFDNGIAFDGIATVFDKDCNEVCNYGGFRLNNDKPCDAYQEGISRAEQLWPEPE